MKRDLDIVRELLFYLEECEGPTWIQEESPLPDRLISMVLGHALVMIDGGLLLGDVRRDVTGKLRGAYIQGISWEGYEYLDTVRNDTVWNKTKEKMAPFGQVPLEIVREVAVSVLSALIKSQA